MSTVFANGCFDLLHIGHVRHLRAARAFGGRLVVLLTSDRLVRLEKGEARPRFSFGERREMLLALRSVDEVLENDDEDITRALRLYRPAVFVKGIDYAEGFAQQAAIEALGIAVRFTGTPKHSSTRLMEAL